MFHRRTNHFLDLTFAGPSEQQTVLTLRLDKSNYRAAIQRLQQTTSRAILASASDAKALQGVRTEAIEGPRTLTVRRMSWPSTSAVTLAADPDGNMVAALLGDGTVQAWHLDTGATHRWHAVGVERDKGIYPPPDVVKSLFTVTPYDQQSQRVLTRSFTKVKRGK